MTRTRWIRPAVDARDVQPASDERLLALLEGPGFAVERVEGVSSRSSRALTVPRLAAPLLVICGETT